MILLDVADRSQLSGRVIQICPQVAGAVQEIQEIVIHTHGMGAEDELCVLLQRIVQLFGLLCQVGVDGKHRIIAGCGLRSAALAVFHKGADGFQRLLVFRQCAAHHRLAVKVRPIYGNGNLLYKASRLAMHLFTPLMEPSTRPWVKYFCRKG